VYGVRLLERARALGVQTHLVATPPGILNVHHELGLDRSALEALADPGACPR
jgi:4-hydroxy-3-polyprenylbenzoate decarboxylase